MTVSDVAVTVVSSVVVSAVSFDEAVICVVAVVVTSGDAEHPARYFLEPFAVLCG